MNDIFDNMLLLETRELLINFIYICTKYNQDYLIFENTI
jgi:hypothetical protein